MCPALVSEIVTEDAPVSRAIGQFSPVAGNSQNSLGKFTSFLKWRIAKTMKVAISRFDNAEPAIVMLIQLLTLHSFMCRKESILINILRIVLKILNN